MSLSKFTLNPAIDYPKVRHIIEQNTRPTPLFYLMNGLAAVIAGYGLLANSPAVVIGAMLIAMMVAPITGIALALIDYRGALLRTSLFSLLTGGILIYAIGLTLGWLYPEQAFTGEILSRTAPNTMDLMVALAGGVAGALAMVSPNLSVAVVGVAVATALVPPLTASGILLANGETELALGAFLLTFTNILAIQFTNSLVLWLAGFRRVMPEDMAKSASKIGQITLFIRRNVVTALLLLAVSVYLALNFNQAIKQQTFEKQVKAIVQKNIENQPSYLVSAQFDANKSTDTQTSNYLIRVLIQGLSQPTYEQVRQMENQVQRLSSETYPSRIPIKLQVRFVPEQVIQSTAISKDDVKLEKEQINQMNQQGK